MVRKREYKGYYCKKCHTYSRIYRSLQNGQYSGTCPRCGQKIVVATFMDSGNFFVSSGIKKEHLVNIWDRYGGGQIIGTLPVGTPAKILETTTFNSIKWFKIRVGKVEGWISGAFIRKI